MDKDYSKREIDIFMVEIKEKLDTIIVQTTKTNGRVNLLENWRSYTAGAVAIIVLLVIPIMVFLSREVIRLGNAVSANSVLIKNQ